MNNTIIIFNDFGFINGGAAKVAIQSAIGLANRGEKVIFFCSVGPINETLENSVTEVVCTNQNDILSNPLRVQAMTDGIWNIKAYKEVDRLLMRLSNEKIIVHVHGWIKALSASIFKAFKKHNVRPFVTLHDYFAVCPNGGFYNFKMNQICNFSGLSLSCARCNCDSRSYFHKCWRVVRQCVQDRYVRKNEDISFVYISNFEREKIKKFLNHNSKPYLVSNPIAIDDEFLVNPADNNKFIYIGRISAEKGVDLFCEAIQKSGLQGIVIGDGVEKNKLENDYPEIYFAGWMAQSDMGFLLKQAKALVFPSRCYEGAPLTVPEVMSHGVPCIVSDNCAAKDYIIEGLNGILFKNGDVNDLKKQMLYINSCSADSSLFNSEKWNFRICTTDDHVDLLLSMYNEVNI